MFLDDLKDGEQTEVEFCTFLDSVGWDSGRNTSKTITEKRFYDLWAQKKPPSKASKKLPRPVFTFELKRDRKVSTTGNIYLEHEALEHSRADYIVYQIDTDNKFYMLDRGNALALLHAPQFKQVSGGDKWGTGSLIPLEDFVRIFKLCDDSFKN
jgi:hypothetical protein